MMTNYFFNKTFEEIINEYTPLGKPGIIISGVTELDKFPFFKGILEKAVKEANPKMIEKPDYFAVFHKREKLMSIADGKINEGHSLYIVNGLKKR